MNYKIIPAILLCLLCLTACSRHRSDPKIVGMEMDHAYLPSENEALKPDPQYQAAFKDLLSPPVQTKDIQLATVKFTKKIERYRPLTYGELPSGKFAGPQIFLRQLIIFCLANYPEKNEENGTKIQNAFAMVMQFYDLNHDGSSLTSAILPLMESKDPRVQFYCDLVQGQIETISSTPNFSEYQSFLEFHTIKKKAPPAALIHYMIQKDPSAGIQACIVGLNTRTDPEAHRALLWATHTIDDYLWKKKNNFLADDNKDFQNTLTQLALLQKSPWWWVRLYVAETLHKNPELQTPTLTKALAADKNEYVKSALQKGNKK